MALAASRGRGDFLPIAPHPVLIAAELQRFLEPAQLAGLAVTWIAADQPTPKGDYVAIVPLLTRWVGGTEFKGLPKLKIVANCAAGHDNVDVVAAELRGITVTNTPDALIDATADLAWALILACARRVVEGTELVRSGRWAGWHPELLLGTELRGRTLGLFGAGRIGQAVGRRAVPFGMRIVYAARNPRPEFERETGAARVELPRLLKESDVLSLHVPAVPETKGRSEEHTSELQSQSNLVCRLLLENKNQLPRSISSKAWSIARSYVDSSSWLNISFIGRRRFYAFYDICEQYWDIYNDCYLMHFFPG